MKLQDGNLSLCRLRDGCLQIIERPGRASIAGRGNQQRMIEPRLIRETAARFVRSIRGCRRDGQR